MNPTGYLTLTPGTKLSATNVTGGVLHYSPIERGNTLPIFDGTSWQAMPYATGTDIDGLQVTGGSFLAAGTQRDVYGILVGGVPYLGYSSSWSGPNQTKASRGIVQFDGWPVNDSTITLFIDGGGVEVPAHRAIWLGSVSSTVAGQLTCQPEYGTKRLWEVWNAHQQQEIVMQAGEIAPSGTTIVREHVSATWPETGAPAFVTPDEATFDFCANVFSGDYVTVETEYFQSAFLNCSMPDGALKPTLFIAAIARGETGVPSGTWGFAQDDAKIIKGTVSRIARDRDPKSIGLTKRAALVAWRNHVTVYGGEGRSTPGGGFPGATQDCHSVLIVKYKG